MFQMQAWVSAECGWRAMEDGKAGHVWRPRATAVDAAAKCLAWTGFLGIPAMQVVNLATGDVVWRLSDHYPDAGPPIALPDADEQQAHAAARAVLARDGDAPRVPRPVDPPAGQLGLGV
jgi:hypothetical protein